MEYVKKLEEAVSAWPRVSVHSHRFGGREFRIDDAEIGHVHNSGVVDIPFPRSIRDALLAKGLAEEHHWVPDSGWITYRMSGEQGLAHALWLMRLSYLRYVLKRASDPHEVLRREAAELHLSPDFRTLLEQFLPGTAKYVSAERFSA